MSANRPPSVLDAWDELTRDVRPPARASVRTRRTTSTLVPLLVGAVVLCAIAIIPNLPQGLGRAAATSLSSEGARATPSPTDLHVGIKRRLVKIWGVSISDDRRSVRIDFIGASAAGTFDPSYPCSEGYEATAEILGEELAIGLYSLRGTGPFPTASRGIVFACTDVGYARTMDIPLVETFGGNVVRDLAGQTFFLGPPDWLASFGALPDGWELRDEGNSLGNNRVPRWQRTWSPARDPDPLRDPLLELFHSHGGPALVDGGADRSTVEINGLPAELHFEPAVGNTDFGEMVLLWSIGDDGFALVGYTRDFTRDELIRLAESVTLP